MKIRLIYDQSKVRLWIGRKPEVFVYPIDIQKTTMPKANMASEFDILDNIPEKKRGMGVILSLIDRKMHLCDNLVALPLNDL